MRALDVTTSWLGSTARLGYGMIVTSALGPRPEQPLVLYEFEGCPWCRRVREALTNLDLQVDVRPCPKGGERHRPWVVEHGGKSQFPFLVDPNTGDQMYESDAIVEHLYRHYGSGPVPASLRILPYFLPLSQLASLARIWRGALARPSHAPEQPLELYSFEASPYCRLAREALCELELPYRLVNVGKRSPSRAAFIERAGKMRVPWLHDPNTGTSMYESADIVRYLNQTYGA